MCMINGTERRVEPGPRLRVELDHHVPEVGLVLRARAIRLVEQLDLRREIRDLVRVVSDRLFQWAPDVPVAPEYPIVAVGLIEQELDHPARVAGRPAPEAIDLRPRL